MSILHLTKQIEELKKEVSVKDCHISSLKSKVWDSAVFNQHPFVTMAPLAFCVLFADDTNALCCNSSRFELIPVTLINSELKLITKWFKSNRLFLNIKKIMLYLVSNSKKTIITIWNKITNRWMWNWAGIQYKIPRGIYWTNCYCVVVLSFICLQVLFIWLFRCNM